MSRKRKAAIEPRSRRPIARSTRARRETRFERAARERSQRARAHLDRVQSRNRAQVEGRRLPSAVWIAACFAGSLGIGLLLGTPAVEHAAVALQDEPARIHRITVQGTHHLDALEVANATGLARGGSLVGFDATAVEERLAQHVWIRRAGVMPLPTGEVLVRIEERRPIAVLQGGPAAAATRFVDGEGIAFAEASEVEVSQADAQLRSTERTPLHRFHASGTVDATLLREAVALADQLGAPPLAGLGTVELWLPADGDPTGWRAVFVRNGAEPQLEVVLGIAAPSDGLARLHHLLVEAPQEVHAARSIDLRFADQAVVRTRLAS